MGRKNITRASIGLIALFLVVAIAAFAIPAAAAPGTWTQAQVNAATTAGVDYIDALCAANVDGHCGSSFPFSETGMALVAYSVEQSGVGGFNNMPPAHQAHVKAAIHYLLINQGVNGSWADFGFYETYSTGIDLAGLSAFTTVDPGVPTAITHGRNFLINLDWQGPPREVCSSAQLGLGNSYCGGWNYDPGMGRSDESNTGYAMFGLQLTGGVPASIQGVNTGWQNNVQSLTTTNPQYAGSANDGGGSYEPFCAAHNCGSFSSNANDTGSMLFGYAYDGVLAADPRVQAGVKIGQDVLDVYELTAPGGRNMVYHTGVNEDGACAPGSGCDWSLSGGEGGYHYSLFSLTKGLGEYIPPALNNPSNWYAKVVDLLLTEQATNGSWPQDGRDDASVLIATSFAVSALGLVAVAPPDQPITATGTTFNATEGAASTGAVATFTDPDSTATAAEYSATIDWGDGSPTTPGVITGTPAQFTVTGTHTYAEEGSYTITVTITDVDNSGNSATVMSKAIVADAQLHAKCAMPPLVPQTYSGPTATFTDDASTGMLSDFSATINWGDGSSPGTISGGPGNAPYTVSGSHTYSSTGPFTVTTTIKDDGGSKAIATCSVTVFAFPTGNGATFVIGDLEAKLGNHVTWWSSKWQNMNPTSGGEPGPDAMKGFAGFEDNPLGLPPVCGGKWTTDPGNATPPPPSVPAVMAVIVSSKITKTGETITGDIKEIAIVKNDPGYAPSPGHPGTGTVLGFVCVS